jgi:hypothetical protein
MRFGPRQGSGERLIDRDQLNSVSEGIEDMATSNAGYIIGLFDFNRRLAKFGN